MFSLQRILKLTCFASLFLTIFACAHYQNDQSSQTSPEVTPHSQKIAERMIVSGSRLQRLESSAFVVSSPVIYPPAEQASEKYQPIESQKVKRVSEAPVSTFSIDVDTGSYSNVRRFLKDGIFPDKNAVRLEEMVNYFDYQYDLPEQKIQPFKVSSSLVDTPWNTKTQLLSVAIKGWQQSRQEIPPLNLVFLVDVSGSMDSRDKLPLVKKSLALLTKHLDDTDKVSIVVYAGSAGVVLEPTSGVHKSKILSAIDQLRAGGGTNGASGIEIAYQLAAENFIEKGVNRVLLATDGDFNVGVSDRDQLVAMIEKKREQGIFLNTLGFGSGNYNEYLMEQLADKGNGHYAYIDSIIEAKKVLVDEIASTLNTIAKDVKIQLEFNPAIVHEYRLLGYENRALDEADFNNDKVDAGEIGAGHSVTALYEISLTDGQFKRLEKRRYQDSNASATKSKIKLLNQELGWIKLRYKNPEESKSQLVSHYLKLQELKDNAKEDTSIWFAAAVAAFAQRLKNEQYLEGFDYAEIISLANKNREFDPYGRKAEFIQLVGLAQELSR